MDLWPLLLALAIMLNLIELLARKGWLPGPGPLGLNASNAGGCSARVVCLKPTVRVPP